MRSRRDLSRSSSKGCLKRVVIEGLKPPFDKDNTIRTWLARYGTVEEIERFYNSLVVKFSSELQAAEAVRCENGIRSSGSNIKVHLADSETIRQLIQRHSRRKRSLSQQQRRSTSSRSESSTRPARKPYLLPPPFPSSRLKTLGSRGLDVKSQAPKRESSAQESREATTSAQPQHQRHSRQRFSTSQSSNEYDVAVLAITHDLVQYAETVQALLHRRAIEEGSLLLDHDRQKQQQQEVSELHFRSPRVKIMVLMSVDHIAPCMQDLGEEGVLFAILLNVANMTHNSCTLRILHSSTQQEHRNMPLPDAIDLLLRDFADYLEAEAASSAGSVAVLKASSPLPLPAPLSPTFQQHLQQSHQQQSHQQTHHRRRCCRHRHRHTSLSSLSTCTSISSSSLSFRSASSSATSSSNHLQKSRRKSHQSQQQKQLRLHHRHHHQQQQHSTREEADTSVTALGAETIPAPDDPNFLAPSRHVAVLLRMLADSRILSVGELDEISAFIAQRRARLTSELTAAESLVHRLPSSPHLYIDTSEALQMNETAFSSASEVIVTPNVGPKEPEFLHREALPVSRYQAIFSDPSNRRRLRAHRGLRGRFKKNGSE